MKKINICGIYIDNVSMHEVITLTESLIKEDKNSYIVTPNIDHIVRLQKDAEFRQVYKEASLVLTDGMPLVWGSKLLGTPLKEKVSGSDLFPNLCKLASERGYKVFFLGGRMGAALKASEVLKLQYSNIQIVGNYAPPFGFENDEEENNRIVKMIIESKPHILFVGLGAPKQEIWIYRNKNKYNVPVSIGIGASLDFVSGVVKRAPLWMQKVGLEWFWRLKTEPKRLWKRYLIDDMKFFWLLLKQKIG
jgi:N-acetylglucosaminyldiphosphoundecaprenol N-acetyl-beta-D-mannosaminyltransferase